MEKKKKKTPRRANFTKLNHLLNETSKETETFVVKQNPLFTDSYYFPAQFINHIKVFCWDVFLVCGELGRWGDI